MTEHFRPVDLYDAYPGSDLLSIYPPNESETWEEFLPRAESAGDTLFLFVAREVSDCMDSPSEIYKRLMAAMGQLAAVAVPVSGRLRD